MVWNYIVIALRNLMKYRVFSFINIFGLAISMSVCLLIVLMLHDLKQYDRFHDKKDRIYRIISRDEPIPIPTATTPAPLAEYLSDNYSLAEKTVSLQMGVGGDIDYENNKTTVRGYFTDRSFFDVFSFGLEKGDPNTALQAPNSIVISKEKAELIFGKEDPLGKVIEFNERGLLYLEVSGFERPPKNWGPMKITGVIDMERYKSHLKFDVLVSSASYSTLDKENKIYWMEKHPNQWNNINNTFSYVLLEKGKDIDDLNRALQETTLTQYKGNEGKKNFSMEAQSVLDISPGRLMNNPSRFTLPLEGFYFLSFLAILIMLSACLNYTNLSVARALTRVKEVGIRKVNGAGRKGLIFQFIGEAVITSLFALSIAVLMVYLIKPAFMSLWINKFLGFDLSMNVTVAIMFVLFAVLIGAISGAAPALYLSKFHPIAVFRKAGKTSTGKMGLRKALTISQFVISLFFISSSVLIYVQLNHYLGINYGFATENIVNIELQGNDYRKVINEFSKISGVERVSACEHIPATGIHNGLNLRKVDSKDDYIPYSRIGVDENFIDNLDIKLLAGNNFSIEEHRYGKRFIIINESMLEELGHSSPLEAIGTRLEAEFDWPDVEVIGVVKNFRHQLPMEAEGINPLLLVHQPENFSYVNVKIASDNLMTSVGALESKWKEIDPSHEFRYRFLDDQMAATHQIFVDLVSIVGYVAFLAITLACMGLLGIATYNVERRTREIGIRKVFGAGEWMLASLLSRSFVWVLVISVVIAAPITFFVNNAWLQLMPNRVSFGWQSVAIGAVVMLVLGLITIGSQTLRASKANPVDSLKSE